MTITVDTAELPEQLLRLPGWAWVVAGVLAWYMVFGLLCRTVFRAWWDRNAYGFGHPSDPIPRSLVFVFSPVWGIAILGFFVLYGIARLLSFGAIGLEPREKPS